MLRFCSDWLSKFSEADIVVVSVGPEGPDRANDPGLSRLVQNLRDMLRLVKRVDHRLERSAHRGTQVTKAGHTRNAADAAENELLAAYLALFRAVKSTIVLGSRLSIRSSVRDCPLPPSRTDLSALGRLAEHCDSASNHLRALVQLLDSAAAADNTAPFATVSHPSLSFHFHISSPSISQYVPNIDIFTGSSFFPSLLARNYFII